MEKKFIQLSAVTFDKNSVEGFSINVSKKLLYLHLTSGFIQMGYSSRQDLILDYEKLVKEFSAEDLRQEKAE